MCKGPTPPTGPEARKRSEDFFRETREKAQKKRGQEGWPWFAALCRRLRLTAA